jgi:site-specific DNA recombinase
MAAPRVAIYCRISSDRETTQAGVNRQLSDCLEFAAERGLNVTSEIIDNNVSAYDRRRIRPGWRQLQKLIADGALDGVLVWHTDRLYRHPVDLEEIIALVEIRNLTIWSVTAGEIDLNTPTGRLVARLLGSVARNEVEHKAERQSRAHLELARRGKWQGGPVPLGFLKVADATGKLELHPVEAPAMQEAAARLLAGHSLKRTSLWFSLEISRDVRAGTLRNALLSPTIAGYRVHIPQGHRDKWATARARREVSGNLPPTATKYQAEWPPVLDLGTWNQLQALLLDPARSSHRRRPEKSLLAGLARCHCGGSMGFSQLAYKCAKPNCGKVAISSKSLERLIIAAVSARVEATDSLTTTTPTAPEELSVSPDPTDTRRKQLLRLFSDAVISHEELVDGLAHLELASRAAADRASDAIAAQTAHLNILTSARKWSQLVEMVREGDFDAIAELRETLKALLTRIVISPASSGKGNGPRIDPSRVQLEWKHERKERDERPAIALVPLDTLEFL